MSTSPATSPPRFGDRLRDAIETRRSQIVLGIDPDPARLWSDELARSKPEIERIASAIGTSGAALLPAAGAAMLAARCQAAAAVLFHCRALIDAAGPACVAVKPQLACFERLGFAGWLTLEAVCEYARGNGLLVLADGKRGDVPVTAAAYAQALLAVPTPTAWGDVTGLRADAVTINPLLGRDSLEPVIAGAREKGDGVFILVRTSNAGAADVLDTVAEDGSRLWERLARAAAELGEAGRGRSGLTDVGAVTGATAPRHLERMRELMPHTPFLLPGVGAQGGDVASLGPAFAAGRGSALVTASRSIANAHEQGGSAPSAARREAERLRELAWAL